MISREYIQRERKKKKKRKNENQLLVSNRSTGNKIYCWSVGGHDICWGGL